MAERGVDEVGSLFRLHYAPMCRLAFLILGDEHMAEEIVMEALLKTFSSWRKVRDPSKAESYLKRTVVNLCRSKIRRRALETRTAGALGKTSTITTCDPAVHGSSGEVWRAVLGLPERQRACVVLRYYVDMAEAEIAEVLDCSVGTVKSQLFKARHKLERSLADHHEGGRG